MRWIGDPCDECAVVSAGPRAVMEAPVRILYDRRAYRGCTQLHSAFCRTQGTRFIVGDHRAAVTKALALGEADRAGSFHSSRISSGDDRLTTRGRVLPPWTDSRGAQ